MLRPRLGLAKQECLDKYNQDSFSKYIIHMIKRLRRLRPLGVKSIIVHKVVGLFFRNTIHMGHLVSKLHSVEFVGVL